MQMIISENIIDYENNKDIIIRSSEKTEQGIKVVGLLSGLIVRVAQLHAPLHSATKQIRRTW
jgi:hypothetical protein